MGTRRLSQDELSEVNRVIDEARSHFSRNEFDQGLELLRGIAQRAEEELQNTEPRDFGNAYDLAKKLSSAQQEDMMRQLGVKKMNDLKDIQVADPYITQLRDIQYAAIRNMAAVYYQLEDWENAITHLENAVSIHPTDGDAWTILGAAQLSGDNPKGAGKSIRRGLRFLPHGKDNWTVLAAYFESQGRSEELEIAKKIIEVLENRGEKAGVAAILYKLLDLCILAGDIENAQGIIDTFLQADPDDTEALLQSGCLRIMQGDLKEAINVLKQALKKNDRLANVWFELGRAETIRGKYKDASKAFEKALSLSPDNTDAQFLHAMTKDRKNKVTCLVNIVSRSGENYYHVHTGIEAPLGMRLVDLLAEICSNDIVYHTNHSPYKTLQLRIAKNEDGNISIGDYQGPFCPKELLDRDTSDYNIIIKRSISEVPHMHRESVGFLLGQYNTFYLIPPEATPPEAAMVAMVNSLLIGLPYDIDLQFDSISGAE
ncbi:MAG: tetratricopeptide repeat protein [Promethearchaeota archaeon]